MEVEATEPALFTDMELLLQRPSAFPSEEGALPMGEFTPGEGTATLGFLQSRCRVLVVGAGGLGCEILKNLALSGVGDIHVIDMDTIDVSNLNRQFLFRTADVGRPKAEVAAEFVRRRVPSAKVTHYVGKIQDHPPEFFAQFSVIISGLDNIEARRWLNSVLVNLVQIDEDGDPDPETIVPFIDGGTEGFAGQARVILPRLTSCFECSIDAFPPQKHFPLCTIAETPRKPEHCVAYAYIVQWPRERPADKLDKDSPEHMSWVYEKARERADTFGIEGVSYMSTMGVVKNIIPAVASTNALVSGVTVLEALKVLTFASQSLNTYMMYHGATGVHSHTFEYNARDDCAVCGSRVRELKVSSSMTLAELFEELSNDPKLQLAKPSAATADRTIYMPKPPALEAALRGNLARTLAELELGGEEVTITDPVFPGDISLGLKILFTD
eukprot:CAMPEP_0118856702 /NCGR_PEP_ID=MMETSP1163-20130328/4063_1 /TAXON_ID=124430 /ORGANISM="Phaeomonas parva, Strain CCMP2877" /LENGTH=440 /DNA_ID=CAMNT_0006789855 /DNA_START=331 /DNA_END=1653 /DNA_ORIENTATION=-